MSSSLPPTPSPTAPALASANAGFDHLFANELVEARAAFEKDDSPFHLLGLGVCAFLEAALGMESGLMTEAARLLAASEAGAKKAKESEAKRVREAAKSAKPGAVVRDGGGRFAAGVEYEILMADAVVLLGLTQALSESYMGYLQCMYSLNAAHSKFTKLYKTVFPAGLDAYHTPVPSRTPSFTDLAASTTTSLSTLSVSDSATSSASASTTTLSLSSTPSSSSTAPTPPPTITKSLFGRWGGSSLSVSSASSSVSKAELEERERIEKFERERPPQGSVEEMVVAGTAFGFGLFNLVFSLLPKRVQSLVGLLGFKHDRELALRALAVSAGVNTLDGKATGKDVHGVFAGLVLMTFHGVVLLLSGYQADEAKTLRTYRAIVDSVAARYPTGALWILNRAKILRMSNDGPGAIAVLQAGLAVAPSPEPAQRFTQADTLLVFELAWTLLAQRRHQEAADAFVRLTELNSWSHATYLFIAGGCYISLGQREKAQEFLDRVPELLSKKRVGGKDLPTEVMIRKKLEFYREKQKRRGGDPAKFVEAISISTADELAIFWNTHQRITDDVASAHVRELAALSPPLAMAVASPYLPSVDAPHEAPNSVTFPTPEYLNHQTDPGQAAPALDTPDESALRALLVGILHRTLREYAAARTLLEVARDTPAKVSTWLPGVASFELAVLELKEADADGADTAAWARRIGAADKHLDAAQAFAGKGEIDLSSRLDSRIALLRDEIGKKRVMLGMK
ncbi:hypothetical protein MIND_01244000 [Mycena indigotica]|uniref:Mitochondrial outer membrane protein IML2 n=1 Tax=Mycena indigotica TaxID=2126181 RepID=A0A8H6VSG2_9AGAR|nr:uncharacterized protein MIND_01244000 [Mycena indigotica]KAF7292169.1 hypothetical protein MIND_01244000 [Mycena indigotica]